MSVVKEVMLSRVAAALLLAAAVAHADLPLSPPTFGSAVGAQSAPSIANNAGEYFAVWVDARRGGPGADDVFGSRVDANGMLLDPLGIRISTADAYVNGATVLPASDGYAVFWGENFNCGRARLLDRNGRPRTPVVSLSCGYLFSGSGFATNGDSYAAMTPTSGVLLVDRNLQTIRAASWNELTGESNPLIVRASIASDGRDYLIVATVGALGPDTRLMSYVIGPDGRLRHTPAQVAVTTASPQLVFTGRDYVLVQWHGQEGTSVRRLDRDGLPAGDALPFGSDPMEVALSSAGDGSAVFLANTYSSSTITDTVALRVTGTLSQPNLVSRRLLFPTIACSSGSCVVAGGVSNDANSTSGGGIVALPTDLNGAPKNGPDPPATRTEMTTTASAQYNFAALRGAPSRLVAWEERDGKLRSVVMIRDLLDPTDAGRAVLAAADAKQYAPALASNGAETLLVWQSADLMVSGPATLKALRLAPDGAALDTTPLTIATASIPRTLGTPDSVYTIPPAAVAWSGSLFLIAYPGTDGEVHVARISAAGTLVDPGVDPIAPPLRSRDPQSFPVLAAAGDEVFLLWQEGQATVCWFEGCAFPPPLVRMLRLSTSGAPVDPQPLVLDSDSAFTPDAAWNGRGLLAVWQSGGNARGRFFGHDGVPSSPAFALGASSLSFPPSVVARADGTFDVAWILELDPNSCYGGAVATRVGPSGSSSLVSLSGSLDQRNPRLWILPSGLSAAAYERVSDDPALTFVPRIRYAPLGASAPKRRTVGR